MKALNSPELLVYINSFNGNVEITLECPGCSCKFTRFKKVIQSKFGKSKSQKAIFCTHTCASTSAITLQEVDCLQCFIIFKKAPNQIRKTPNNFCSQSCAATYNNTHKTKGNRRSKLECWLEEKLKITYPNLEIKFNTKKIITSELDIYVPLLQLAFEINGILHYEPIYGSNKLALIQNNDKKKLMACLNKGIKLNVINTSKQTRVNESTSIPFLEYIIEIINNEIAVLN
jgi:hypothetical protein